MSKSNPRAKAGRAGGMGGRGATKRRAPEHYAYMNSRKVNHAVSSGVVEKIRSQADKAKAKGGKIQLKVLAGIYGLHISTISRILSGSRHAEK